MKSVARPSLYYVTTELAPRSLEVRLAMQQRAFTDALSTKPFVSHVGSMRRARCGFLSR